MGRQQQQSRYQRQLKGSTPSSSATSSYGNSSGQNDSSFKGKSNDKMTRRFTPVDRQRQREDGDAIDMKFGFHRYVEVYSCPLLDLIIIGFSSLGMASQLSPNCKFPTSVLFQPHFSSRP
jgi:hypothetical protein